MIILLSQKKKGKLLFEHCLECLKMRLFCYCEISVWRKDANSHCIKSLKSITITDDVFFL